MPQRELVADVVVRRTPEHGVVDVLESRLEISVGAEVFERRGCRRADDEPAEREHSAGLPPLMLCADRLPSLMLLGCGDCGWANPAFTGNPDARVGQPYGPHAACAGFRWNARVIAR